MASVEDHKRAMKRLRDAGIGAYVVITREAGSAGIPTRYPIGVIVALSDTWTVTVRRVGQTSATRYAAAFWEPAPNGLIAWIRD